MKYRALGNLYSISQGDFVAFVENGRIELPEDMAEGMINSGVIAPLDTEYEKMEQINGGLHDFGGSQASTRKRRKRR